MFRNSLCTIVAMLSSICLFGAAMAGTYPGAGSI